MSSDSSSIAVVVRVRPFSIREAAQLSRVDEGPSFFGDGSLATAPKPLTGKGVRRVVKVVDERMLVFDPADENPMARYQKTILPQGKRVKDMRFGFDRVFDETCTQQDVYEATTKSLLDSVLDGYNSTVFAYGATGCGKTHTISGNPQNPGIIFMTCAELFERINSLVDEKEIDLSLSYLEIYNETIRDLLVPGGSKMGLQLREDTNKNIAVAGLSTHTPKTVEQVMDIIVMGNMNRTQSPTEANATSSRSHAVLQINVAQKPRTAGVSENHMYATLSIIDLAGSERASVTKNRGDRLLEGANINRSLLALGNCINSLCDPRRSNHVPYRDSKLTRLLKFSLGGNCKTVMIVCVSPSSQHYDETHNTLKYANRAKEIKTKVSRNVMNVNRHVSQYVKAIFDLRQEVDSLKNRLKDSSKEATDKNNKHRLAKETSIKEGLKRLRAAYDHSKPARDDRINNLRNLKLLERRISLVTAWLESFDVVFENRNGEEAPQSLLKLRVEADKVLKELYSNQQMVKQRLSGPGWDKAMDIALQQGLRSLYTIDGATETDAAVFNTEGNLLRITAERDILEGLNGSDVDSSFTISALTRAHFVAFATLSKVMENNAPEAEAVEAVRKSLFEVQRSAGDAVSQIIKPSGELAPTEVYQPSVYQPSAYQQSANQQSAYQHSVYVSPTKKKSVAYAQSPMKSKLSLPVSVASASPLRSPVRYIKSPRKTHVKFNPRPKKQVQWAEELVDPVSEGSHRRIITNDSFYSAPLLEEDEDEYEDSMLPPPPPVGRLDYESQPLDQAYVPQGVAAPPIRPTRNKLLGSLAAGPPRAPEPSHGPLHSFDNDQVSNLLNEHLSGPGAEDRPWRPTANKPSARSAVRKSIAGGPTRPMTKRRSPSNSSQTSPDLWKTGQRKRMHRRSEKENNGGSMTSVLSPKSSGIRGTARRMTATSGTHGMSSLTLAGLRDSAVAARMRESMTPGGMRRESMAAGAMRRESMAPGTARRESMAPGGMRR